VGALSLVVGVGNGRIALVDLMEVVVEGFGVEWVIHPLGCVVVLP
jgi:hypothetical protein